MSAMSKRPHTALSRHPSLTCYSTHGCRCPECTELNTVAVRARRGGTDMATFRKGLWAPKHLQGDRGPRFEGYTRAEIMKWRGYGQENTLAEAHASA